ncbi:hypothetical protein PCC7418_3792 [Halothece sp. PCC 7418]|uniref:hypothetical protein n=1 Tax=Halothece sp. (strain PCC 7418) TaxID=65093 RepID=UPI0002A08D11|nr:hypothetical protein [Halothece sp. PCC 7418]AFZ45896.1 hypothetical protein PCC7418_3792 [Halothece sp. PCC 7418]
MKPQQVTTLALSSLLIFATTLPANAQLRRERTNRRGGTVTGTADRSRHENGGFSGTRNRIREGAYGGTSEVNGNFETDGNGNFTGVRDRAITGPNGNTVTCENRVSGGIGSGYEASGGCN